MRFTYFQRKTKFSKLHKKNNSSHTKLVSFLTSNYNLLILNENEIPKPITKAI